MQLWTQNLSTPLTITNTGNVKVFRGTILASGGTVGITGTITFQDMASEQIVLIDGQGLSFDARPQEGANFTITPLTGVAVTALFFN